MVNSKAPPGGVYTPSPTFFTSDGKVDLDTQIKHIVFLADNGISGVVLLGSTGEMVHLTQKERVDLISGVRQGLDDAGKSSFPIHVGIAQQSIGDALEEVELMKKAGALYAMVLAPNYFASSTSQEGISSWFVQVADKAVLPVIIYYYPGVSNNLTITPDSIVELSQHPNIVGIKQSHGNVSDYAQISLNPIVQKQEFAAWTGLGQLLLPAMTVGITGTIDAISGAFPKTLVKLYELSKEGKVAEAQKIQYTVAKVADIVVKYGPVGTKWVVHVATGLGIPQGRAPLNVALNKVQSSAFDSCIAEAIKIEKSLQ